MYLTAQDLFVVRELEKKAMRVKERELPKIENRLIKKLTKKIPIHQN